MALTAKTMKRRKTGFTQSHKGHRGKLKYREKEIRSKIHRKPARTDWSGRDAENPGEITSDLTGQAQIKKREISPVKFRNYSLH